MKINTVIIALFTIGIANTLQGIPSSLARAKTLVRGAREYRKQTLPKLYDYLEIAGLGEWAKKFKSAVTQVEATQTEIETYLEKNLTSAEFALRKSNKTALERQQILMTAKVTDEINKLFNALDNIMSNLAKYVRDYRQEQQKIEPEYSNIKQELSQLIADFKETNARITNLQTKIEPQLKTLNLNPQDPLYEATIAQRAPEIVPLKEKLAQLKKNIATKNSQKKSLDNKVNPILNEYYSSMEKDSSGLFNFAKSLGTSMQGKTTTELAQVESLNKMLEEQKKKFTSQSLLDKETQAHKNLETIQNEIDKAISLELSETEQRLWGIIKDLYQRVLLTEAIILQGPKPIEHWTLPKVLGIKLPETATSAPSTAK